MPRTKLSAQMPLEVHSIAQSAKNGSGGGKMSSFDIALMLLLEQKNLELVSVKDLNGNDVPCALLPGESKKV